MALPERFELIVDQGATLKHWFAIKKPDGTIADLPNEGGGYSTGWLRVRSEYSGTLVLDLTTDNGGVVLGLMMDAQGQLWSGYVYAPASATAVLTPWGDGVFDLDISDGSDVIRIMTGPARLRREAAQ
jgi:hypothetical protein